jgi:hypothetical protein
MSTSTDALQAPAMTANAAWQKAVGSKLTVTRLEHLPALLSFDGVDEPIQYDGALKLLCYRGFMCNASYVQLRRLSDNAEYIAALEQLYVGSSVEESRSSARLWLGIAGPLTVAIATGMWLWLR